MGVPLSVLRPSTARVNWCVVLPDPDAQLDDVVAPDLGAVLAHEDVVSDIGGEVEGLGGPGAAQAGGEVGGGGDLAGDGAGGIPVEQGLAQSLPFGQVAVDDRPGAGARGGDQGRGLALRCAAAPRSSRSTGW